MFCENWHSHCNQLGGPDARLYRKGNTASKLRYMGQALNDNRTA